jgi:hypothetical protein
MTASIAESWSFGRGFVDDGLPALFPRSRHRAGWATGGAAAAKEVSAIQLLLPLPVAALAVVRRLAGSGAPRRAEP